jgi:hypothetical protein
MAVALLVGCGSDPGAGGNADLGVTASALLPFNTYNHVESIYMTATTAVGGYGGYPEQYLWGSSTSFSCSNINTSGTAHFPCGSFMPYNNCDNVHTDAYNYCVSQTTAAIQAAMTADGAPSGCYNPPNSPGCEVPSGSQTICYWGGVIGEVTPTAFPPVMYSCGGTNYTACVPYIYKLYKDPVNGCSLRVQ